MKKLFLLSIFLYFSCVDNVHNKVDNLTYYYIYDCDTTTISKQACDSICMYSDSSYEKSLKLYKNYNSFCKGIPGFFYINVFKHYDEKYAILIDSTTKIYKLNNNEFKKLYTIPVEVATSSLIKTDKIDFNSDGYKDVVIQIPTGGTAGDEFICLFYNPIEKTLIYDSNSELRNIEFDIQNKKLKSNYRWSSAVFNIEQYSFSLLEDHIYLNYTCNDNNLKNMEEVITYNKKGDIINRDTLLIR